MSEGLKATFRLLSRTPNEAAVQVLIPAIDSPRRQIRDEALAAILSRRSPAGHREILARLDTLDEAAMENIRTHSSRIAPSLRSAIVAGHAPWCANACRVVAWLRAYDLIPALIAALEDPAHPSADLVGETLLEMAKLLDSDLSAPEAKDRYHAPDFVRRQAITALERSVERFAKHRRNEVLDALLLVVKADNPAVRSILRKPRHSAFPLLLDMLSTRDDVAARLLLGFLDDANAPGAALGLIAKRSDEAFVEEFVRKIGEATTIAVRQNLKRMDSVAWLHPKSPLLEHLDDAGQEAAVRLAVHTGMPHEETFRIVDHLLLHGKPGGRRAACEALGRFNGPEANELVLRAMEDPDAQVQAHAAAQLRRRGMPGAMGRLMELVDSPFAPVRQAARESLAEFSFKRYLRAFDLLDEQVRRSTGALVKKVDAETLPSLYAELNCEVRSRRLRGLAIAQAIDSIRQVEDAIIRLLSDEDHMVRADAATALAKGDSPESLEALEEALLDRSPAVSDAARKSLVQRRQPPSQPTTSNIPADPREGTR